MVHSVEAVSSVDKVKRDANKTTNSRTQDKQSKALFSQILDQKKQEQKANSMECHTVTYGQDSRLRTFQYQSREYNY